MSESTVHKVSYRNGYCGASRGNWKPLNIAAMVAGFVIFWPVGLAILFYNIFAEQGDFTRFVDRTKEQWGSWHDQHHGRQGYRRHAKRSYTGNAAFDDYREETLQRLDEERRRLEEEIASFREFQEELKRKQDRDEFDRFMDERKPRRDNPEA